MPKDKKEEKPKAESGKVKKKRSVKRWDIKMEDFMMALEMTLKSKGNKSDLRKNVIAATKSYNGRRSENNCTESRVYTKVVKLRSELKLELPMTSSASLTEERKDHWKERLSKYDTES